MATWGDREGRDDRLMHKKESIFLFHIKKSIDKVKKKKSSKIVEM